jgi:hypothetical protein
MSYAKKLAIETVQTMLAHKTVSDCITTKINIDDYTLACMEFVVSEGINQAMQAQREADFKAAQGWLKRHENLEEGLPSLLFTILNAEVEVKV